MIRRNMNKTPSKADISVDYGLKFFTAHQWKNKMTLALYFFKTFGYTFHFGQEVYVKCILASQQFLK